MDTIEGFPEVDEVNKKGSVPLYDSLAHSFFFKNRQYQELYFWTPPCVDLLLFNPIYLLLLNEKN